MGFLSLKQILASWLLASFLEGLTSLSYSQLAISFLLGGSDIIKLLFNTILKYTGEQAIEKLNKKNYFSTENSTTYPYTSLIQTKILQN